MVNSDPENTHSRLAACCHIREEGRRVFDQGIERERVDSFGTQEANYDEL